MRNNAEQQQQRHCCCLSKTGLGDQRMSSTPLLRATVSFVHYNPEKINRNGRKTTVDARIDNNKKLILPTTPSNVLTCLQVKKFQTSIGVANYITICASCGAFELECFDTFGLRHLRDNSPVTAGDTNIPRRLRCRTWWTAQGNLKSPPPSLLVVTPCSTSSLSSFSNGSSSCVAGACSSSCW